VDFAETELRRRMNVTTLEQASVVQSLFQHLVGEPNSAKLPEDDRPTPPSSRLMMSIMTYLLRSRVAAGTFPQALQAAFACMFGTGANARLKSLGLQFTHRIFEIAAITPLTAVAPVFLSSILKIIRDSTANSQDRGLAVQAVGKLSLRCTKLFEEKVDLVSELFGLLATPDTFVRSCTFDALTMLRGAFKACNARTSQALLAVLEDAIASSDSQKRLLAVQYATELYSSSHMPSRYICLLASVDEKEDIKSEGERGLRRIKTASTTTSELFVDPNTEPVAFPEVIRFFHQHVNKLAESSQWSRASHVPPFEPLLFARILVYIRTCLGCSAEADEDETTFMLRTGGVQHRLVVVASYLQTVDMIEDLSSVIDEYIDLIDLAMVRRSRICS
jgi:proteasome component ECM29